MQSIFIFSYKAIFRAVYRYYGHGRFRMLLPNFNYSVFEYAVKYLTWRKIQYLSKIKPKPKPLYVYIVYIHISLIAPHPARPSALHTAITFTVLHRVVSDAIFQQIWIHGHEFPSPKVMKYNCLSVWVACPKTTKIMLAKRVEAVWFWPSPVLFGRIK